MEKEINKQKIEEQPIKNKSVIDLFFKMGDWATGGDPARILDFQYYMIWILFLAFSAMFISNIYRFVTSWDISFLIWALIGFAIASLQYLTLKNFYAMRKARKEIPKSEPKEEEHKVEDIDEMLKGFKSDKKDNLKGG